MKSHNNLNTIGPEIRYVPADEESAREFLGWKYDPPYDVYNYAPSHFEEDLAYHLDPQNNIHSMYRENELIGYCSFGRDAQVLGGDYSEDALDIGLMIRPELTGQGMGTRFVANIIQHAIETFSPSRLRVTILESNKRAMKVWEKNGFQKIQAFESEQGQLEFSILTRDVELLRFPDKIAP